MGSKGKFIFLEDEEKLVDKFGDDNNDLKIIVSILSSLDKCGRNLLDYFISKDIFIDQFNNIQDFVEFYHYFLSNYPLFEKCYMNECLDEILKLFFNEEQSINKEPKIEKKLNSEGKISVDIYSIKCPKCGSIFIIGELEDEELKNFKFECPSCDFKLKSLNLKKNTEFLIKETIIEKEIKLISYEEALKINLVNPCSVLYSYDKRNWMICDSDPLFWPENSENIKVYFTTLSFK